MQKDDFLSENGHLLSKFEEVHGHFLQLKSQNKSQKAIIDGLKFEVSNYKSEIERLKKANVSLKEQISDLEFKIKEESFLVPENFKIRKKIAKIVTDIEESESTQEVNLKDYLETLIEEIDICINQLTK